MNIREHNELCGGQTRLYIGNLPFSMMEAHLRRLLSQVGVTRVQIEMGPKRAAERRFAFANMSSRDEKRTIESLDGQIILGTKLRVGPARPKFERAQSLRGDGHQ